MREQIAEGQPRTHRPWKKIMVIVEGIYSMEGELCKLTEIVSICKRYKVRRLLNGNHSPDLHSKKECDSNVDTDLTKKN